MFPFFRNSVQQVLKLQLHEFREESRLTSRSPILRVLRCAFLVYVVDV